MTALKLLAEDDEDLKVISAALQDAVAVVGDISYEPAARRLTLLCNRYRWEKDKRHERVRTALQIGAVNAVQTRKLRRDAKDAVISLLAVTFEPEDAPSGHVVLSFAGGGDLRLAVECVDAVLADVTAPWPTPRVPKHDLS